MLRKFLLDESGAITVDWVVLTAAVTGLGIAAVNTVSDGRAAMTEKLQGEFGNSGIYGRPVVYQVAQINFDDGQTAGWTSGSVLSPIASLGNTLVIGPGDTAELALDVPSNHNRAVITFDLIGGDSLDNETATISINGQTVLLAQSAWGGYMNFQSLDLPGVTVATTVVSEGSNLGGAAPTSWKDSVTTVSILVEGLDGELTFAVQSGANQAISDEYFALDNIDVKTAY